MTLFNKKGSLTKNDYVKGYNDCLEKTCAEKMYTLLHELRKTASEPDFMKIDELISEIKINEELDKQLN
jgi:hypothetical protein